MMNNEIMENTVPSDPNMSPEFFESTKVSLQLSPVRNSILLIVSVLLILTIVGTAGYHLGLNRANSNLVSRTLPPITSPSSPPVNSAGCTEEAKLCPDGSSVGRTGPDCEFADCPTTVLVQPDWQQVENSNLGFSFRYPANLNVFNLNRTAGLNQQVLYELSRSETESVGDYSTGVYLVSYYPQTTVEELFAQFTGDNVYLSNQRAQIISNGLTIHLRRTIPPDGPGAGIETMLAAVELKDGILTFDLISNGSTREQDTEMLESILKTLVIE